MLTLTRGSTAVSRARPKYWARPPTIVLTRPMRRSPSPYPPDVSSSYRVSIGCDPAVPPRSPPRFGTNPLVCVRVSTPSAPARTTHGPNPRSVVTRHDPRRSAMPRSRIPTSCPRSYRVTPTAAVVNHAPSTSFCHCMDEDADDAEVRKRPLKFRLSIRTPTPSPDPLTKNLN